MGNYDHQVNEALHLANMPRRHENMKAPVASLYDWHAEQAAKGQDPTWHAARMNELMTLFRELWGLRT